MPLTPSDSCLASCSVTRPPCLSSAPGFDEAEDGGLSAVVYSQLCPLTTSPPAFDGGGGIEEVLREVDEPFVGKG